MWPIFAVLGAGLVMATGSLVCELIGKKTGTQGTSEATTSHTEENTCELEVNTAALQADADIATALDE